MKARKPAVQSLTPQGATISSDSKLSTLKSCLCCEAEFKPKTSKRAFCKDRCRLLYWAAGEIVKEYQAGRASGLEAFIEQLR